MATFTLMTKKAAQSTFDAVLAAVMQLDFNSRSKLLKLLAAKQREELLLDDVDQAHADLRNGAVTPLTLQQAFDHLDSLK